MKNARLNMPIVIRYVNHLSRLTTLVLTLLYAAAGHAEPFTIEQLMQTLAQAKPSHATFTEVKYIALLEQPIESSGELFFTAPGHLEKRTLQPSPESLVVDGNNILIERGGKTYYFTLQNMPELGAFISGIRGTLAGDLNALKRSFQLHLEGDAQQWALRLIPTNENLHNILQHIHITGLNYQIRGIEIVRADGDRALMTISPTGNKP